MKDGPEKQSLGAAARQSRMARLSLGGSKGAQATVIGFVLVGPIVGGFLIGAWLDQTLGTGYWTILLGLLGVFSGFREMFMMLTRLTPKPGERTPPPGRSEQPATRKAPPMSTVIPSVEEAPRSRLFSVPPPPFMEQAEVTSETPTSEEVLERLLGKDETESDETDDSTTRNA